MNRVIDEERHAALMSEGESIRQARAILDLLMTLYYDNATSDYIAVWIWPGCAPRKALLRSLS